MGLDQTDIAACYRNRAKLIVDGDLRKPSCALVIEFDNEGKSPTLVMYRREIDTTSREDVSLLLDGIQVLACAASSCNAQASN